MRPLLLAIVMYAAVSVWAQVHSFLSVEMQNDYLDCGGHGTDRYYTAGNRLQYLHSSGRRVGGYQIAIMQQAFTPADLQDSSRRFDDYPYAGLLFLEGSVRYTGKDSSWYSIVSVSAGATGKASGVASLQRGLHRWLGDEMPNGWHHILELGNYFQIEWSLLQDLYSLRNRRVMLFQEWEWGTVYKKIKFGLHCQAGVSPAISLSLMPLRSFPDKSSQRNFKGHHRVSAFVAPDFTFVITNRILERGLAVQPFENLQYGKTAKLSKALLGIEAGVGYQFPWFAINYHQVWQQREFAMGLPHHYGSITVLFSLRHSIR